MARSSTKQLLPLAATFAYICVGLVLVYAVATQARSICHSVRASAGPKIECAHARTHRLRIAHSSSHQIAFNRTHAPVPVTEVDTASRVPRHPRVHAAGDPSRRHDRHWLLGRGGGGHPGTTRTAWCAHEPMRVGGGCNPCASPELWPSATAHGSLPACTHRTLMFKQVGRARTAGSDCSVSCAERYRRSALFRPSLGCHARLMGAHACARHVSMHMFELTRNHAHVCRHVCTHVCSYACRYI